MSLATLPQPRRAAIYVRISKDEDGDELAIQRHEKLCRKRLASLGWSLVDVYADNNLSASKRKKRPAFDRMVEAIEAGEVNAIVTTNSDRLARDDLRGIEDLIDLLNTYAVEVNAIHSGVFDMTTSGGRAQARMAGVFAKLETDKMSERLTDMHADLIEKGRPNGGPTPYGYERVGAKLAEGDTRRMVPVPAEAAVVVEIIGRVAAGETLTAIATSLNERGDTGRTWNLTNVRRLVLNGRYAGRRMHNGKDEAPLDPERWPALVDEGTWRRAKQLLTADDRPRRAPRKYLLTGVITCAECDAPLRSKPLHAAGRSVPAYACRPPKQGGCGGVSVRAEPLEQLVAEAVVRRVESPAFARAMRRRAGADPKAAETATQLEAELAEMAAAYGEGAITLAEWKAMRPGVERRLAEARSALAGDTTQAAAGRYAGQTGKLAEAWPTLTLDKQRAIVRAVVVKVAVRHVGKGTAARFNPERVSIEWR